MMAIQQCEEAGISTALVYNDAGYGRDDPGFVFALPEADAIVCAGSRDQPSACPRCRRSSGATAWSTRSRMRVES